jgi:sensor histidine kinase regulating citrate/malate metabolism
LQTALYELLTNAILATEYGGTIRLEQKISLEMGMLTVQVTDFGVGLTQAEQTALFSAQHEVIPGIGSVPAVRNAIRAIRVLNGKIWLKSKKVSYTTFRFQIPVRIID